MNMIYLMNNMIQKMITKMKHLNLLMTSSYNKLNMNKIKLKQI